MTINKEVEFNNIINDILKNKEFIDLKYEIHHGISRLDHSLNVARLTYKMCKRLHVKNYIEITRAALLHDFFRTDDVPNKSFLNHPLKAVENSKKTFDISAFQENIIAAHMFPVSKTMPKYLGSWIVSSADKAVAIYECTKYKVPLTIGATFLFFINICFIQR